jgi:hypothetical protein
MGKARYTPEQYANARARLNEICDQARREGRHSSEINDWCQNCGLPMYSIFHTTLDHNLICQWCAFQLGVENSAMTTDQLETDGATFREVPSEIADQPATWFADITRGRVYQVWKFDNEKQIWNRESSVMLTDDLNQNSEGNSYDDSHAGMG